MPGRLLICTDLDRTLIPNGPDPESPGARRLLARLAERSEVTLAFVSGRHRALVEEAIAEWSLPVPDFVIGDVGTTIYRVGAGQAWHRLESWERAIGADWAGRSNGDLRALLEGLEGLRLQEESKQNRLKLSYYLPLEQETGALADAIRQRLDGAGIRARLVFSIDDLEDVGLLDVLPARASKRHAIEALMFELGFDVGDTVFCGDSGNDLEVLVSPIPAVLVANSRPEVRELACRLAAEAGAVDRLYVARGGFLGMNGNYGGGMLEGIAHYHGEIAGWLAEPASNTEEEMA